MKIALDTYKFHGKADSTLPRKHRQKAEEGPEDLHTGQRASSLPSGLATMRDLLTSPWVGASWEGFALEQVLALLPHDRAFYWGTHQGAEVDLLLQRGTELYGVEIKRVDAPRITKSMRISRDDLSLERIIVIYPGDKTFSMGEGVTALPLKALSTPEAIRKFGK